ncbi:MAG: hypothetical protein ACJAZT_001666 [Gammaproteobacteria bacterium]|jgi:hypothetical protein
MLMIIKISILSFPVESRLAFAAATVVTNASRIFKHLLAIEVTTITVNEYI